MTDTTVLLFVLLLGGAAMAAFDLHRREMRDVLGAVGFFVLGFVLGAILELILPGGVLIGGLGGTILGMNRLEEVRRLRRQGLEEELNSADSLAERMLLLHDRLDRVRSNPKWTTKLSGTVAIVLLSLVAGVSLLVGLLHGAGELLLLGGIAVSLPAAALASRTVRSEEDLLVSRALTACEDEAAGVLDEPPTRNANEGRA